MNTRALILLFPMPTSIWIRGRLSFFTSKISGNIFYFLICFRDKHFIFNLFSIAANGFIFECRELQHTECCVSVLGRISIDGPCFVRKVDGLLLDAWTSQVVRTWSVFSNSKQPCQHSGSLLIKMGKILNRLRDPSAKQFKKTISYRNDNRRVCELCTEEH
jgi:hypothetical protein